MGTTPNDHDPDTCPVCQGVEIVEPVAPKKYVSPHAKPTPYQREVLTIMMEEAAEIIQMASKILRFGAGYPGSGRVNTEDLGKEIGELNYMVFLAKDVGLVTQERINDGFDRKAEKLAIYMQENR